MKFSKFVPDVSSAWRAASNEFQVY